MNVKRVALLGAITTLVIAVGMRDASAQSPQSGYYGYPSAQAPAVQNPATACQPSPPGCQVEYVGCHVAICPCPCTTGDACDRIKKLIPPIRPAPSCQEVQPCVIDDELPPSAQVSTVTIYRNCYVPLRIKRVQSPSTVNAVNIQVNWCDFHYLCGEDGKPLSSQQSAEVLKQLQTQLANGIDVAPGVDRRPPRPPRVSLPACLEMNPVRRPPAVSQASTPNAAPAAHCHRSRVPRQPRPRLRQIRRQPLPRRRGYGGQRCRVRLWLSESRRLLGRSTRAAGGRLSELIDRAALWAAPFSPFPSRQPTGDPIRSSQP